MELVYRNNETRFSNLKMFEPFEQCRKDFPVESYSKVFFCGNTGAGKSSFTAVIMERAKKPPNYKFDTSDPIPVDLLTTGINAHTFSSHEVGNMVLYDLAGHKEYYSSHAAILMVGRKFQLLLKLLKKLIIHKNMVGSYLWNVIVLVEKVSKSLFLCFRIAVQLYLIDLIKLVSTAMFNSRSCNCFEAKRIL